MEPGTQIRCEMTKWGERPHWQFEGIFLGADEHGEWIGFPVGTHNRRPGLELVSEAACVTLVPRTGWHLPTFHTPGIWCDLYVDVSTPAVWDGDVLRAVDLDLDVIRMSSEPPVSRRSAPQNLSAGPGEIFVDDEDEFAEHQVAFGYPAEVIEAAQASCDEVLAAVRAGEAPYDGTHERWFTELSRLTAS